MYQIAENIELVKKVVESAYSVGVTVEAELGKYCGSGRDAIKERVKEKIEILGSKDKA